VRRLIVVGARVGNENASHGDFYLQIWPTLSVMAVTEQSGQAL
jgi:hypothetical protein